MINSIIKKVKKSNSNMIIMKNTIALMILQIANVILPLISIPYLLMVLGPGGYGSVAFAIATITFMQIVVDYGFNLTATREITLAKNKQEINKIYTTVIAAKLLLAIPLFFLGLITIKYLAVFKSDLIVNLILLSIIFSNVLISTWFFQGIQKMKYITYINVFSRICMTLSIFIIIKEVDDNIKYAIIYVVTAYIIGILGQILTFYKFRVRFTSITINNVLEQLVKGKDIFFSSFLSNVLSSAGIFILGLVQGKEAVGYYSAAEKLVKAIRILFVPFINALFPQTNLKFAISFISGYNYVYKGIRLIILPLTIASLMVAFLAYPIFKLIYDPIYWNYYTIMSIGSIWIFLSILNNFYGIQMLVGSGNGKRYTSSFLISVFIVLPLYVILSNHLSGFGIMLSMIIGEGILTLLLLFNINKIKYKIDIKIN